MFKKTKTMKFVNLDYAREIGGNMALFFRDFDEAVSQQLIRQTLSHPHRQLSRDTVRYLKTLDRKFGTKFDKSVVTDIRRYVKKFDFPTTVQLLEAYLSYLLKDLSTNFEDPFSENETKEETKPKAVPTLREVIEAHNAASLLSSTLTHTEESQILYERTLFHSIVAVRDRLICTGHCDIWSAKYAESWIDKSRELLRDDLALQAAKQAVSQYGKPFIDEVLTEIANSVCRDVVFHIRMGKRLDESNNVIAELLEGVTERISTIKISSPQADFLMQTIISEDVVGVQKCVFTFVKDILHDILSLVENVVRDKHFDQSYLPDKESPVPFPDKYGHEALLRLSASFFSQCENLNCTLNDFIKVSLRGQSSQWLAHFQDPIELNEWLLAVPIQNLQVDGPMSLGNITIVPSDKCPEIVTSYFSKIPGSGRFVPSPLDERVWAFVEHIFAASNDPERVKTDGRRQIQEALNSILVLIDNRDLYDYRLGHLTYTANTNTTGATLFNGIGSGSAKFPVELTGDRFPVGTKWGEYLSTTMLMDSPISNRMKRAFNILASARQYEFLDQRFLQYLTCLETLLRKELDSDKYAWLDRAAIIMAGPNITEHGFTYRHARIWLRDDLDVYLRIRDAVLQGKGNIALDRVIERFESIVVGCVVNLYASLNDPDFNELDQLTLWFVVTRPQDGVIGGVST